MFPTRPDPTLVAPAGIGSLRAVRELNGIRGLAALIVFFAHCLGFYAPDPRWGALINTTNAIARSFNTWVDVFFVLSGYLITHILLGRRSDPHYFRNFYWRRALRILPLYLVSLVAVLLIVAHSAPYVLLATFFLANFNGLFRIPIDGPFWTLAIEEQFYLLWPTILRRRSIPQLRRLLLAIALTVMGLRIVAALARHNDFNLTFFRVDGLALGAWLACYFFERKPSAALIRRENLWFTVTLIAGAIIALLAAFLPASLLRPQYIPRALAITGMVIAYTGLFGLVLAHHGQRGPQAILRSRFLGFFGLISYALYMTHVYVIVLYDRWHAVVPGNTPQYLIRFIITFTATTALSLASRYLIELPALSLRRLVLPPTIPSSETQLPLREA